MRKEGNVVVMVLVFMLVVGGTAEEFFSLPKGYEVWKDRSLEELLAQESSGQASAQLFYNISYKYMEKGNFSSAKVYLFKAIAREKDNSFLYGELGRIYLKEGVRDSAVYYFERSLELNYENIPIWNEIVQLMPKYYFNLGKLYEEKGREHKSTELLGKAIEYLQMYEAKVPDGEFIELSRTARNEINLLLKDLEAKKRREEHQAREQEIARAKAEALRGSMRAFREENPYYAGVGFASFSPANASVFYAKDPSAIIEDSVVIKQPISEFTLSAGGFIGPIFAKGYIGFGSAAVDKTFLETYNYNLTPPKPIYGSVTQIKSFRFGGSLFYNPFFRPPMLLLLGINGDIARYTPIDRNDRFKSISGSEAGLELLLMLYFRNFLFDIGYSQGIIGERRGGKISVDIGYKF